MNNYNTMTPYADTDHDSGVEAFRFLDDGIVVKFKSGTNPHYEYSDYSAGSTNIEQMKILAITGDGLNAFINKNVRKRYSRNW